MFFSPTLGRSCLLLPPQVANTAAIPCIEAKVLSLATHNLYNFTLLNTKMNPPHAKKGKCRDNPKYICKWINKDLLFSVQTLIFIYNSS